MIVRERIVLLKGSIVFFRIAKNAMVGVVGLDFWYISLCDWEENVV